METVLQQGTKRWNSFFPKDTLPYVTHYWRKFTPDKFAPIFFTILSFVRLEDCVFAEVCCVVNCKVSSKREPSPMWTNGDFNFYSFDDNTSYTTINSSFNTSSNATKISKLYKIYTNYKATHDQNPFKSIFCCKYLQVFCLYIFLDVQTLLHWAAVCYRST